MFFSFQFRFKNYSADAAFTFTDSAITATGEGSGYEIDGTHITIEASGTYLLSGDITILSSDDCMNAANSDLGNYDFVINISGGSVVVWTANRSGNQSLDATAHCQ